MQIVPLEDQNKPLSGERRANREAGPKAADNLVEILAADLVAVFTVRAPEVDLVQFGLLVADAGRRLEETGSAA